MLELEVFNEIMLNNLARDTISVCVCIRYGNRMGHIMIRQFRALSSNEPESHAQRRIDVCPGGLYPDLGQDEVR